MSEAFRHIPKYTIADYEQWEGDWELWDGHPIAMTPSPSFDHQNTVMNVAYAFRRSLDKQGTCRCKVISEVDWRVANDTIVRPDLMVICEPVTTKWVEITPTLVAEVLSPSTKQYDSTYKRDLYASQGVKYYLIADPDTKTVELLRLQGKAYHSVPEKADALSIKPHDGCLLTLPIGSLWA